MAVVPKVVERLEDLTIRSDALSHPRSIDFQPDPSARSQMAKRLGLVGLPQFTANVELQPWLDGIEILGQWRAEVVQTCGVSLEDFATELRGEFQVRSLPADSRHRPEVVKEVIVEADGEDPPDVMEEGGLDLSDYLMEHLSLEVDPFPRKPGVQFEPPEEGIIISPFAALKGKIS